MNNQVYLKNVSTLTYDPDKCTGCGDCALVRPHRILQLNQRTISIIDLDRCMECAACMQNCSKGAINVKKGVGCAAAVITGFFKNSEPTCGCTTTCG